MRVSLVHALLALASLLLLLLFLKSDWIVPTRVEKGQLLPAPPALPCRAAAPGEVSAASGSSMFTAEEILYFTTGKGDRAKHERRLVEYVRQHIARPSGHAPALAGVKPVLVDEHGGRHYSEIDQSKTLDDLMKAKRDGFFIECGASTGEQWSNSLFFELERNWTGLLVEANPQFYEPLLGKQRNAYVLTTCLSPANTPTSLKYKVEGGRSGLDSLLSDTLRKTFEKPYETTLTCFPLQSVLDAIGVKHIDLLMLDVEGAELPILRSLAWERLTVHYMLLEYGFIPSIGSKTESLKHLDDFKGFLTNVKTATGAGFDLVMIVPKGVDADSGKDVIFRQRDVN